MRKTSNTRPIYKYTAAQKRLSSKSTQDLATRKPIEIQMASTAL